MEKLTYETPEMEMITFETEDVISNSYIGDGGIDGGEGDLGGLI